MEIINLSEFSRHNYSVNLINSLKQYWVANNKFSCINNPKKANMLMYLDGFDAEYIFKDGRTLTAHSGNVVYIPIGAEYEVSMVNPQHSQSNTIGVNFYTYALDGQSFIFSKDITIFDTYDKIYYILFNKVDKYSEQLVPNYTKMKAGFYDILANLCDYSNVINDNKYSVISRGILYLESETDDSLSIPDVAKLCNVSEAYFRRLFKEFSGMSPIEYRLYHKIKRAKKLLEYEHLSVTEISEMLSFVSPAYFIKVFKRHTGMTPLEYKKSII